MESRKKVIKGSSFREQFETLPKDRQDEYLQRFKNTPDYEDYLMALPEEIRQKIVLEMDPFYVYRLYNASLGPFKKYCDEVAWRLKIKNDFPRGKFVLDQPNYRRNLVWTYFSLFFSELKYVEYQRKYKYGDALYLFVYEKV